VVRRLSGALVVGALLLVILVFSSLLGARALGLEPLVVRSGSMESTIHTGSLVLVDDQPAADIAVGDVAVVDPPGSAPPRLHRVIERFDEHGHVFVRTQGDANRTPDADVVALPPEVPTPALVVPALGYVVTAVSSRSGMLAAATVIVVILGASALWAMWRPTGAPA
jgi:signal peptidase I